MRFPISSSPLSDSFGNTRQARLAAHATHRQPAAHRDSSNCCTAAAAWAAKSTPEASGVAAAACDDWDTLRVSGRRDMAASCSLPYAMGAMLCRFPTAGRRRGGRFGEGQLVTAFHVTRVRQAARSGSLARQGTTGMRMSNHSSALLRVAVGTVGTVGTPLLCQPRLAALLGRERDARQTEGHDCGPAHCGPGVPLETQETQSEAGRRASDLQGSGHLTLSPETGHSDASRT